MPNTIDRPHFLLLRYILLAIKREASVPSILHTVKKDMSPLNSISFITTGFFSWFLRDGMWDGSKSHKARNRSIKEMMPMTDHIQ